MKNLLFLVLPMLFLTACKKQILESNLVYEMHKSQKDEAQLLILLHGLGSNEKDLFSVAEYLDPGYTLVCPRAPYEPRPDYFAWYEIEINEGEMTSHYQQAGMSLEAIDDFVDYLIEKYHFKKNEIVIGGFSQGGIMSLSYGLYKPEKIRGVISLSGIYDPTIGPKHIQLSDPIHVLAVHGNEDDVLPVEMARNIKVDFEKKGIEVDYYEIDGLGHSINNRVLQILNEWLSNDE